MNIEIHYDDDQTTVIETCNEALKSYGLEFVWNIDESDKVADRGSMIYNLVQTKLGDISTGKCSVNDLNCHANANGICMNSICQHRTFFEG